jgi:rubrerythrin
MINLEELLGVALKIEGSGYEFYTKLANRSSGKNKEIFKSLANQEREHMKRFEEIVAQSKEKSGLQPLNEEAVGYLRIFAETSIFPEIERGVPADLKDALEIALDVEKDSVVFYEELLKYAPQKETIQKIVEEEKKHFKDILKMIEDLKHIS